MDIVSVHRWILSIDGGLKTCLQVGMLNFFIIATY